MLKLIIPASDRFDEVTEQFVYGKETVLQLEHSLVSLSKWESKWKEPFLGRELTFEELLDYIRCMTLTQNTPPEIYQRLTTRNIQEIRRYIGDPMTATKPRKEQNVKHSRETLTSEVLYSDMIALGIPFECQKWHLNRLMMLIRVCDLRNRPPKKMSQGELLRRNASLNASRRKKLHTRG